MVLKHAVHVVAPALAWAWPAGHSVHEPAPAALNEPAGQFRQDLLFGAEYLPAGQIVHTLSPAVAEKYPNCTKNE